MRRSELCLLDSSVADLVHRLGTDRKGSGVTTNDGGTLAEKPGRVTFSPVVGELLPDYLRRKRTERKLAEVRSRLAVSKPI